MRFKRGIRFECWCQLDVVSKVDYILSCIGPGWEFCTGWFLYGDWCHPWALVPAPIARFFRIGATPWYQPGSLYFWDWCHPGPVYFWDHFSAGVEWYHSTFFRSLSLVGVFFKLGQILETHRGPGQPLQSRFSNGPTYNDQIKPTNDFHSQTTDWPHCGSETRIISNSRPLSRRSMILKLSYHHTIRYHAKRANRMCTRHPLSR